MVCNKCGKEIQDDTKYCNYCGNPISREQTLKKKSSYKAFLIIGIILVGLLLTLYTLKTTNNNLLSSTISNLQSFTENFVESNTKSSFIKESNSSDAGNDSNYIYELPEEAEVFEQHIPVMNELFKFHGMKLDNNFHSVRYEPGKGYVSSIDETGYYFYGELKSNRPSGFGYIFAAEEIGYVPRIISHFKNGMPHDYTIIIAYIFTNTNQPLTIEMEGIINNFELLKGKYNLFLYTVQESENDKTIFKDKLTTAFKMIYNNNVYFADSVIQKLNENSLKVTCDSNLFQTPEILWSGNFSFNQKNILNESHMYRWEPTGKGVKFYGINNSIECKGEFKKGFLYGKKVKQYYHNGIVKYEGSVKGGMYHGKGVLYYENGNIQYKGEFIEGDFNGKGEFYDINGNLKYKGKFKNGITES